MLPFIYGICLRFVVCGFLGEFLSNCWFRLYECEGEDG